ncbi:Uncharacterised protein [Bordetella pertussis]|nr:Uncharacterised protein [Bordetella pertussis]
MRVANAAANRASITPSPPGMWASSAAMLLNNRMARTSGYGARPCSRT